MSKKSKNSIVNELKEPLEEGLVKSIREIPFRFMATNHRIDENFFLRRVYSDRRYSSFFLSSSCQRKFNEAGRVLMTHSLTQVQELAQQKEERKAIRMMKKLNENENTKTYSNVVSSAEKMSKDQDESQILTGSLREQLANYSPSLISKEFLEYSQIDFDIDDIILTSTEFGKYHASLVDLFLKQMSYDERIIVGIILYGNAMAQKQNRNLYKRFSTSFCDECDAPVIQMPVIQFPELPLPELSRPILKQKTKLFKRSSKAL